MSDEGIYDFHDPGDELLIDPSSLNLYELTMTLAMTGWMTLAGQNDDGTISFHMRNMGALGPVSSDVLVAELGLLDEDGSLIKGYAVTGEGDEIEISYEGVANLKFADFAHRVFDLSSTRFERNNSSSKKGRFRRLLGWLGLNKG